MHQRLDLCDKDSFLDQKLFSKPKQIFVVLHFYNRLIFSLFMYFMHSSLSCLCSFTYLQAFLSFQRRLKQNKIRDFCFWVLFIIHHFILNLFVRFFGVGIVVLSEIILTKKVDTNKNEINFSMWYILFSFLPIRQKGLMKECTTLLYTSPLTHDLASQNRTLSSH